jgi:hypothetical protein
MESNWIIQKLKMQLLNGKLLLKSIFTNAQYVTLHWKSGMRFINQIH